MRETQEWLAAGGSGLPGPDRIVSAESTGRVLLAVASRAVRGQDCADLGYHPLLSRFRGAPEAVRRSALARAATRTALTAEQAGALDADRVARWMVEHYPPRWYPGVVIGSPHGGAVHLATAMGVPWLPAGFEVSVQWPEGRVDRPGEASAYGGRVAARVIAGNPGVRVRQVHDPAGRGVLAGSTVSLVVRWDRLPEAYREFLGSRLAPGAPVLLLRDVRTWPVVDAGDGHSFQLGGPVSGLEPADFRAGSELLGQVLRGAGGDGASWDAPEGGRPGYAEQGVEPGFETSLLDWVRGAGSPLHRVLFPGPDALSAAAADVYRSWLRGAGKSGDRCVVECGRLIDPWQVVRAGLVPYWCENATARSVAGAEWWLAGSAPFSSLDVLPEPPGLRSPALAGLPQWLAVASFGRRRRAVDRVAARGYPVTSVATRHATEVLRNQPYDLPAPAPLRVVEALAGLRASGTPQGLLVC
ncbi:MULTISPECIES: hypothetical protein [unclassified Plantactinospora]|uniref:hypothetical protein n=1 Tax=unclassified Plantactinospora TaxID=2631981 RepID=UPI001F42FB7E|nr:MULTISPECIES: hypothetical protein [unclassified Plantactinospora]